MSVKYLKIAEKNVSLFGNIFSDLSITRIKSTNTSVTQTIKVPITYAGKESFNYLIKNKLTNQDQVKVQAVLPAMGFALKNIYYDLTRQLNRNNVISGSFNDELTVEYNKVPYNFDFELNIAAVHQSDLLQIIEQVVVLFKPDLNLTVKLYEELEENEVDVSVTLKNNVFEEFNTFDTPFDSKTTKPLFYTLNFTLKSWLYCTGENDLVAKKIKEVDLGIWPWDTPISDVTLDELYPTVITE